MKLHRDLAISQKSTWFMAHRLRETFTEADIQFDGPVEVDETYMGGKRRNMHLSKRKQFDGRGASGKTPVVGMKDRETNQVSAKVTDEVNSNNLQQFVVERVHGDTMVYTDDAAAYKAFPHHESVKHSVGEYVREQAHTNGIESFWAMLKRAHTGTFHRLGRKHLQRYVNEFAGRHNLRPHDTIDQMREIVAGMVGKRLMMKQLTS